MKKLAQQRKPSELMSLYVVFLKSLYLLHQQNHWKTPGYAEHMLFQRLYEAIQEPLDEAAEKAVGIFGELNKQEKATALVVRFETKGETAVDFLQSSLDAERAYQDFTKRIYEMFKDTGAITLGLDDMLMAQASLGDVRIYLLQQALKVHGKDAAPKQRPESPSAPEKEEPDE
jgi:DNA-binding ferritin-like protein